MALFFSQSLPFKPQWRRTTKSSFGSSNSCPPKGAFILEKDKLTVIGHLKFFIRTLQLVEKIRCTLPLTNLFPSLARRFACCQNCSVSLRTLWAYGFDSAAPRALEKSKVGEKEKYFILSTNSTF